jgi:hypothetical protein
VVSTQSTTRYRNVIFFFFFFLVRKKMSLSRHAVLQRTLFGDGDRREIFAEGDHGMKR